MAGHYIGGNYAESDMLSILKGGKMKRTRFNFRPSQWGERHLCCFETGADALAAILEEIRIEKGGPLVWWIPAHFCEDTIIRVKKKIEKIQIVRYYDADEVAREKNGVQVVLCLHFNRYDPSIRQLVRRFGKRKDVICIEDFVQCPFDMRNCVADYGFNSFRKILPLDVAITFLKKERENKSGISQYYKKKKKAESVKADYFLQPSVHLENLYLKFFEEAEHLLHNKIIQSAAAEDIRRWKQVDWELIKKTRKRNCRDLKKRLELLPDKNLFRILPCDYFFLMIELKNRDEFRRYLSVSGIFAPVHWLDGEAGIREQIVSLPVDQRYSKEDMKKIADLVGSFKPATK